jgi:putative MATE family efflux protein
VRRSPHDREILRLAVPALGALAAEPLYLLVDTAIVGRGLGTLELAALALAATILTTAVSLCIFLTYGTTARVARLHGAGLEREAAAVAPQALWLAGLAGAAVGGVLALAAGPLVALLGGSGATADAAERYLRISTLGIPCALLALAGQGWLRGVGDLRSPLVVIVIAQAVNAALTAWFVLGLGWGLDGSALATVVAQLGMGGAFVWLLVRRGTTAPPRWTAIRPLMTVGAHLVVRTGALLTCFVLASAVLARVGEPSLAAHQIAFGLFVFLALVLDAIAIAGQVLIGRALGAGDAAGARAAAARMIGWSVAAGAVIAVALGGVHDLLPQAFTADDRVLDRAAEMWPLFCVLWPLAGLVFALDGILIGAGDTRFLAAAMVGAAAVYAPLVLTAGGIGSVWVALLVLMAARGAPLAVRFARGRWALTGAG